MYARTYVRYISKTGKIKRQSVQAGMNFRQKNRVQGFLIRKVCNRFLHNQIPLVPQGTEVESLEYLLTKVPWIQVKKVTYYRAGVEYE